MTEKKKEVGVVWSLNLNLKFLKLRAVNFQLQNYYASHTVSFKVFNPIKMLRKNSILLYIHLIFTSSISVSFAQIDWHDFVVVETIDFPVDEAGDLPPPVTPDELGARLIAQERYERMKVGCFFSSFLSSTGISFYFFADLMRPNCWNG